MSSEHFKVTVDHHTFELENSDVANLDCVKKDDGSYHVLHDGKGFNILLKPLDHNCKTHVATVNGNQYTVEVSNQLDQLLTTMGMTLNAKNQIKDIKAPMPGLILDILVEDGQEISKGEPLLILEAMKMENVLKAEGEGVIKTIKAKKGDSIEKGQIIIVMN